MLVLSSVLLILFAKIQIFIDRCKHVELHHNLSYDPFAHPIRKLHFCSRVQFQTIANYWCRFCKVLLHASSFQCFVNTLCKNSNFHRSVQACQTLSYSILWSVHTSDNSLILQQDAISNHCKLLEVILKYSYCKVLLHASSIQCLVILFAIIQIFIDRCKHVKHHQKLCYDLFTQPIREAWFWSQMLFKKFNFTRKMLCQVGIDKS